LEVSVTELNDLDCKIYVETGQTVDHLCNLLAAELSATPLNGAVRGFQTSLCELDVRENDECDSARSQEFPDGFLYFRYLVELYPAVIASHEDRVHLTARILSLLWSKGYPAIAACDYEKELPHAGGYQNHRVPWPTVDDSSVGQAGHVKKLGS
jgi:hypothetical protein